MKQIAQICGVCKHTIMSAMNSFGIKRRKQKEAMFYINQNPKVVENRRKATIALWKNQEFRNKQMEVRTSAEFREARRQNMLGENNPNYGRPSWNSGKNISGMSGKHHSEESKEQIGKKNSKRTKEFFKNNPEARDFRRKKFKELVQDPEFIAKKEKGLKMLHNDSVRHEQIYKTREKSDKWKTFKKNHKKTMKEKWQDPEYVKKQMKARGVKPNNVEKKLDKILQKLIPNEYKYVGAGEVIIAGKCPDFINANGQKKIIELYGDWWHRNDDPQDRVDLFAQYGYKTLVVWEKELKNIEKLKKGIMEFHVS